MNFLDNAFKSLQRLNEETFDLSAAETPTELQDFLDDSEDIDTLTIIDDEAETEEDIQDSYMGKVILDCNVCHSLLYKDPEEVSLEGEDANVEEECPYCYSQSGFKVIGQVKPFGEEEEEEDEEGEEGEESEEAEEEEPVEEEEDEKEEKDKKKEESFKPRRRLKRMVESRNKRPVKEFLDFGCVNAQGQTIGLGFGGGTGISNGQAAGGLDVPGVDEELEEGIYGDFGEHDYSTSCQIDFFWTDSYDEDLLKEAIDEAVNAQPDCEWTGYIDFFSLDKEYDRYDIHGFNHATGALFDVFHDGDFDPDKMIKYIDRAISDMGAEWDESIYAEDNTGAYNESLNEKCGKKLHELFGMEKCKVVSDGLGRDTVVFCGSKKECELEAAKLKKAARMNDTLADKIGNVKIEKGKSTSSQGGSDKYIKFLQKQQDEFDARETEKQERETRTKYAAQKERDAKNKKNGSSDDSDAYMHKHGTNRRTNVSSGRYNRDGSWQYESLDEGKDKCPTCGKDPCECKECVENEELKEGFNKVDIETDDSHLTMDSDESGKVTITTEPKQGDDFSDDFSGDMFSAEETSDEEVPDETIGAVDDETQQEIETNSEESEEGSEEEGSEEGEEVSTDEIEFDEESFDELGESYLKKVYGNVDSYKTQSVMGDASKLMIEGVIKFTSGTAKKTTFVFESKKQSKGKTLYEGYNKEITRSNKTFKMTCSIPSNKIVCEKLNYRYRANKTLVEGVVGR